MNYQVIIDTLRAVESQRISTAKQISTLREEINKRAEQGETLTTLQPLFDKIAYLQRL